MAPKEIFSKELIGEVESFLGHSFKDLNLLKGALNHPSYAFREHPSAFERLEFLGDRILGCVIAEALYKTFPNEEEGKLSGRLVDLVRKECIGSVAQTWELERYLNVSKSLENGPLTISVLADAGEALLGALFLDAGFKTVQTFILKHWTPYLEKTSEKNLKDPKSLLQEWAQAQGLSLPHYKILVLEGPKHAPHFHVQVELSRKNQQHQATGIGPSRRYAEQDAARGLLEHLAPEVLS